MTDALPSPGWYDDPENRDHQRWWDGVRWSEHRKLNAGSGIRQAASLHSGMQTSESSVRMRYADRERAMRRNNPLAYVAILFALVAFIFDIFALPGLVAIGLAIAGIARGSALDSQSVRYRGVTTAVVALVLGSLATVVFIDQFVHTFAFR